jgi:uncharacterized protein YdeI (YjbR/CyaY-like superfamily)
MSETPTRFPDAAAFRRWLKAQHRSAPGLVLRIAKAHAAHQGITYAEALDEALCFGWIDGVRRRLDEDGFSIRFTPRKPKSTWSRVNVRHVERLIAARRMTPAGLAAYDARQENRTGVYSFEQRPRRLPPKYARIFRANREAWTWFMAEAPWYRRTSSFWVVSAKREATRQKRLATLIACSAQGERIGPLKRTPAPPK